MSSLDPHLDPDPSFADGPGAEPAFCPSCELQHMRRPDWLCPRCGMPVETTIHRPAKRARSAATVADPVFPAGSIVAGAILTATSLVLALGLARDPSTANRWPLVAAAALLGVVGLELVIKVSFARGVAIAVASLAAVVLCEDLLRARLPTLMPDPLPPALRAPLRDGIHALYPTNVLLASALLAGTLLLVVGRPGRARIAAGVLLAAPLAVVQIVRAFVS